MNIINTKNYFGILVSLYIASQIIFPLANNIIISNIVNVILLISYIAYLFLAKKENIQINPMLKIYFLFTFFALMSAIWSINIELSLVTVKTLIFILLTLIMIYNLSKDFEIKEYVLYGILIGAFFNYFIAVGIIDYQTEFTNPYRFVGSMARSTSLAISMILALYATIMLLEIVSSKFIRVFLYISLILGMYVIFLTVSKKGLLIGLLLIGTYYITNLKSMYRLIIVSIIGGVSIYLYMQYASDEFAYVLNRTVDRFVNFNEALESSSKFSSTGERLYFIQKGLDIFMGNPLFGTGIDTFRLQNYFHTYSHNNYIELLANVGLFGAAIYYSMYVYIINRLRQIPASTIKSITMVYIFALLVMDMAAVTYQYKLAVYTLLYVSLLIEQRQNIEYQ